MYGRHIDGIIIHVQQILLIDNAYEGIERWITEDS